MKSSLRSEAIFAMLDQALMSLSNFFMGLFLINHVSKAEYGFYTIGYSVILVIIGFSNALVISQMFTLVHSKPESDRDIYCTSMLLGQNIIFLPVVLLFGSVILFIVPSNYLLPEHRLMIFAVCMTVPGALWLDFFRRYLYLKLKPRAVLSMDLFHVTLMWCLIFIVHEFAHQELHAASLVIYGMSGLFVGISTFLIYKLPLLPASKQVSCSLKEAWLQGRWALGGVFVTALQNQSYVYLLGFLAGAASVADASSAYLFLAPLSVLSTSFTNVFMPRMSKLRSEGNTRKLIEMARKLLFILITVMVCYAAALIMLQKLFIGWAMPEKYNNIGPYIIAWSIILIMGAFRNNVSILLQVYRQFRSITLSSAFTSLLVLAGGYFLIGHYGVLGILGAMAAGELFLAVILYQVFRHVQHNQTISGELL